MPLNARAVVGTLLVLGMGATANDAFAQSPTKDECASASETAQTLRRDRKLQAARATLALCMAKSCPAVIRDDCTELLEKIEKATPTIVLTAKAGDVTVHAVNVRVDGALVLDRLDGTPLRLDPGEHTFELSAAGHAPVTKKIALGEGEKDRAELVVFPSPAGAAVEPEPAAFTPTAPTPESPPAAGDGQRLVAYIIGGAGLVGIGVGSYFGLHASSTYDDAVAQCKRGTAGCSPDGVTSGRDAHEQATISTIAFVAGGALLAGGAVLFLTAPKNARAALTMSPTASASGAGLKIGGGW